MELLILFFLAVPFLLSLAASGSVSSNPLGEAVDGSDTERLRAHLRWQVWLMAAPWALGLVALTCAPRGTRLASFLLRPMGLALCLPVMNGVSCLVLFTRVITALDGSEPGPECTLRAARAQTLWYVAEPSSNR